MKKIILFPLLLLASITYASEYKETTTTMKVPGTAKSVTISPQGTTILCDPTIFECYTVTTVVVEHDNGTIEKKVTLDGEDVLGESFHVEGILLNESSGILPDGSIQHFFLFE